MVLAAGSGTRFGGTKQVARLGGRPLVAHAVATALAAGVTRVVVVVGHEADQVAAAARTVGEVEVVLNPVHADGQASSLRMGIGVAARSGADVAVVLLADEPDVRADAVDAVVGAVRRGALAARARYEDGPGHPVAFGGAAFERLRSLTGDRGARDVLDELGVVEVTVPGRRPRDVDRPEDLPGRR